ncbi:MAG: hypothetical protein JSS34_04070 [Proteobacteria bacterium]|nr:hypothetical protein [Pseudomonadota bacterium]
MISFFQKMNIVFLVMGILFFGRTYADQSGQKNSTKKELLSFTLPFSSGGQGDKCSSQRGKFCEEESDQSSKRRLNSFLRSDWDNNVIMTRYQVEFPSHQPNQIALSEYEKSKYSPLSMAKKSM